MPSYLCRLFLASFGVIFIAASVACSTKNAVSGKHLSVEESTTHEGLFERSTFCTTMNEKYKDIDRKLANDYCEQFGKTAKIFSQTSTRQRVETADGIRIDIGAMCTSKFSCVIKKTVSENSEVLSYAELLIEINEKGETISAEVIESCGSAYLDKRALGMAKSKIFDVKKFPPGVPFKSKFVISAKQSDAR